MKITTFALLFISTFNLCYGGYFDSPKEVQQALDHGAETKIVFFVVDDSGTPVSNAMVSAGFYMNGKSENRVEGKTGNNGIFIAEQMSVGEVNYVITKEGYYKTRSRIWLAGEVHKAGDVKDGKWQPYGKTYTAILKPRKDPVPMCAYYFEGEIPKLNVPLGFDLKAGDFVHPYGKGTIESYYSKIYTPLRFGHKFISFGAYMNLTPNSANLEFDVGNNLQKNPPTSYRINIP